MIADSDTWGGLFLTAPKTDSKFDEDLEIIDGLGYTWISEEEKSGQTVVYVFGPTSAVDEFINDFDLKLRIKGFFFKIADGAEINVALIKSWVEIEDLVF